MTCFSVTYEFDGSFLVYCQENSVPRSFLPVVSMLLYGPDITIDSYSQETHKQLTLQETHIIIAQMLIFNSNKQIRDSQKILHHSSRETPLHMYRDMVDCQKRKRGILNNYLGVSVSYDRVLSISANLTNALCKQYQEYGKFVVRKSKKMTSAIVMAMRINKTTMLLSQMEDYKKNQQHKTCEDG